MKTLVRLWLAASLATAFPWAQTPGTPVLTVVGSLSCGIRAFAPGQVQTYCFYNAPPAPVVTVCNSLDALASGSSLAIFKSCSLLDPASNQAYQVLWEAQPNAAGVQYQIVFETMPCAPPTTTLWSDCKAGTPSTVQSGTL